MLLGAVALGFARLAAALLRVAARYTMLVRLQLEQRLVRRLFGSQRGGQGSDAGFARHLCQFLQRTLHVLDDGLDILVGFFIAALVQQHLALLERLLL